MMNVQHCQSSSSSSSNNIYIIKVGIKHCKTLIGGNLFFSYCFFCDKKPKAVSEVVGGGKRRKTKGGKNNKKKRKSKRRLGGAVVF